MTEQRIDGHEAYRDDPEYTSPEMEPGNGEVDTPEAEPEFGVITGTGMTGGMAGGALAGEVLIDGLEDEREEPTQNPEADA